MIENLKSYLKHILGVSVQIRPWSGRNKLPFFLTDLYDFYEISLFKHRYLLMVAKGDEEITPGTILKHRDQVRTNWPDLCIYVHGIISSSNRVRLIQRQMPFIIPGNQMYLPELGLDLREHFKKPPTKKKKYLTPAAQLAVICVLQGGSYEKITPSILSEQLGYTLMSMKRAFDELNAAGIGKVQKIGRALIWTFGNKKELWELAKPKMRSPVKTRIWLKAIFSAKLTKTFAGLSALAHYSMLNPPSIPVYAISFDTWKGLKLPKNIVLTSSDEAAIELEIWNYNPNLFKEDTNVDPFSLYLSLQELKDERVELALEEMFAMNMASLLPSFERFQITPTMQIHTLT